MCHQCATSNFWQTRITAASSSTASPIRSNTLVTYYAVSSTRGTCGADTCSSTTEKGRYAPDVASLARFTRHLVTNLTEIPALECRDVQQQLCVLAGHRATCLCKNKTTDDAMK